MAKQHGKSDYLENKVLDHVLGGGDYTRPATVYFAWFTALVGEAGGGTEATGGSYARVAVTNNVANFPAAASGAKSNGIAVSWPAASQNIGTALGWGIFDAAAAGNLLYYGKLVGSYKTFTAAAATDFVTSTAHGFVDGDAVEVESESGTVPAGLSENTVYYVRDSTANTFKLAATAGGVAIDLTTDGTGLMRVAKSYRQVVNIGGTLTIPIGALGIVED